MESDHFRARVARLLKRSRQAYRLYSSVGRLPRDEQGEFAEAQSGEWKQANARLSRDLSEILEAHGSSRGVRGLASNLAGLRDKFLSEYRYTETELRSVQQEAISCAEKANFVKLAVLAKRLVPMKARVEALQAAYNELDELLTHGLPSGAVASQTQLTDSLELDRNDELEAGRNISRMDRYDDKERFGDEAASLSENESAGFVPEKPALAPVIPLRRLRP